MPTVTNRRAYQALRGQSVVVTLDATDSAQLDNIAIGKQCTLSNGKIGYVASVDLYGHSFKVTPNMPNNSFNNINNIAQLMDGASVTVAD